MRTSPWQVVHIDGHHIIGEFPYEVIARDHADWLNSFDDEGWPYCYVEKSEVAA